MLESVPVATEVIERFEHHHAFRAPPSTSEYADLLGMALKSFCKSTIVIDALDECPRETGKFLMNISQYDPSVNLLIISRHTFIERPMSSLDMIITLRTCKIDIKTYLEERIEQAVFFKTLITIDSSFRKDLIADIVHKANGM